MRRFIRIGLAVFAALALFACAVRVSPSFAEFWYLCALRPVQRAMVALSGKTAVPACEVIAVALLAALAARPRALRKTIPGAALALLAGYLLMWYPAYFAPSAYPYETAEEASAEKLRALCERLTDRLGAPGADAVLPVKTARYGEWMTALSVSGVYVPWTGEALIAPNLPASAAPFIAAHEAAHAEGLADEGQANIAAYRACVRAGGPAADSARLKALAYALDALDEPATRATALGRLSPQARRAYFAQGGTGKAEPNAFESLMGIGRSARRYDALADWLCAHPEEV